MVLGFAVVDHGVLDDTMKYQIRSLLRPLHLQLDLPHARLFFAEDITSVLRLDLSARAKQIGDVWTYFVPTTPIREAVWPVVGTIFQCSILTLRLERWGETGAMQLGCTVAMACSVMLFLWEMTSTRPFGMVPVRGSKTGGDQGEVGQ